MEVQQNVFHVVANLYFYKLIHLLTDVNHLISQYNFLHIGPKNMHFICHSLHGRKRTHVGTDISSDSRLEFPGVFHLLMMTMLGTKGRRMVFQMVRPHHLAQPRFSWLMERFFAFTRAPTGECTSPVKSIGKVEIQQEKNLYICEGRSFQSHPITFLEVVVKYQKSPTSPNLGS